jgi:hypothetical protein
MLMLMMKLMLLTMVVDVLVLVVMLLLLTGCRCDGVGGDAACSCVQMGCDALLITVQQSESGHYRADGTVRPR